MTLIIRLRGLAPLRKQVAWLQTGIAASRRLYSCSPTRTEVGAPAGERRLAASEDPRRKGLKHLTHTRSDEIRCTTTLERVELPRQSSSWPLKHKAFASKGSKQSTCRCGFGLTHRKKFFLFLFALREGGALFSPHFMRRERASGMHSTAPNTQTCLLSVHCACNTMDGDVSATCI